MKRKITLGQGAVSILRNGGNLLASHWTEALLRLAYAAAITRVLGAENFGLWYYAMALYTLFVAAVGLGFETQLPLKLGTSQDRLPTIGRTSLTLRIGLLVGASLLLILLAYSMESAGPTRTAILVAVPAVFGRGLSLFSSWIFIGLERTVIVFRIAVTMRILEVIVGLGLLMSGFGIMALIATHAAIWVIDGLLSTAILHRSTGAFGGRFDRQLARELLIKGLPLGSAAGLTQFLTSGPILLIKNLFGDLALTGQFALAQQILVVAVTSIRPFFLASLPVLGRSTERGERNAARFGPASGALSLLLFVAAALFAYWLGPPIAVLVFGPEFSLTGQLIAPLMAVGGLMLAPVGYMQMLAARSIHWPDVVAGCLGALALLVAMPWCSTHWGIWGAVAATACAWFVRAIVAVGIARRLL